MTLFKGLFDPYVGSRVCWEKKPGCHWDIDLLLRLLLWASCAKAARSPSAQAILFLSRFTNLSAMAHVERPGDDEREKLRQANGYSELLDKVDGSLTLKPVKPNTEALYNYVLHEWDLCV